MSLHVLHEYNVRCRLPPSSLLLQTTQSRRLSPFFMKWRTGCSCSRLCHTLGPLRGPGGAVLLCGSERCSMSCRRKARWHMGRTSMLCACSLYTMYALMTATSTHQKKTFRHHFTLLCRKLYSARDNVQ